MAIMKKFGKQSGLLLLFIPVILIISSFTTAQELTPQEQAQKILQASNVKGGLIVHLSCGDGKLTAALRLSDAFLVHGLDTNNDNVEKARAHIQSLGIYGPVSTDLLRGDQLPYIDNLVNLVVSEDLGRIPREEIMRVLCPNGVAYIITNGKWTRTIKSIPPEIDDWTHYLHDASNNAVSHDTIVGPPRRMQWIGSPKYGRHHDRMSSVSGVVSANGRIFYIFDEASRASILLPPKWSVIARDAYNGTILWKRRMGKWHTHLWPLKSGPAQLPRRLVASGNRVYVTLGYNAPLTALDAATGNIVRIYKNSQATEEVILKDSILFLLVNRNTKEPEFADLKKINNAYRSKFWDEQPRRIMAVQAENGEVVWEKERTVLPATLAADQKHVYFHDGDRVICLDRETGDQFWQSNPIARCEQISSFYLPILVVYQNVVLFSGGETAGKQTGSWYTSGEDTMTALSAETGKILWKAYHPPSGYRSPEDLLVVNNLVWTGETTSGRVTGVFTGRDPLTGEVKAEFSPDVKTYWFHHRCYRGKATDNYLLMSRAGTEFIDIRNQHWIINHWVRGACLYGVMPANGLMYFPQHPCACYLEAKMSGFNALAPASSKPRISKSVINANATRLVKGPAYDSKFVTPINQNDWPTYRHDAQRSGSTPTEIATSLQPAWQTDIGGKVTGPVVAEGKVFIAAVDSHIVYALNAPSGKQLWQYTAGGRVDSPPTIYQGKVYLGSADGWVYCLRASDGVLAWRFRAAPMDQRLMSFEQLESVWPVHGSVLIQNDILYCVAGRSMFLDDGLRLYRLNPQTGRLLSETILNDRVQASDKNLQDYISWLNMPPALPDILSSDGRFVYMRSQPYHLDGSRLPLQKMPCGPDPDRGAPPATQHLEFAHLFSPTGFLDDDGWHRTYWMYGSTFVSGWCGYFLAGRQAPAGKLLVFDDSNVYGFGRKPQYYRWTTPIEHQLFAADKPLLTSNKSAVTETGPSLIRVEKSPSLNPAGKPLTVEAWVKTERPDGVILAQGGGTHGYVLYVKGGKPTFAVRRNEKLALVNAAKNIVGQWVHLAGVLTTEKNLQIYVNGELLASAKAPGFITTNPADAMQIGADEKSAVGDYNTSFPFKGILDEIRVYHRALSKSEIQKYASPIVNDSLDKTNLVLYYSFDKGDAVDSSGTNNQGKVAGITAVKGKSGNALKFTGKAGSASKFAVDYLWTTDLPLLARAMILTPGKLLVAGPPDLIDEPQTFKQINDPQVMPSLIKQAESLEGKKGALLWVVSNSNSEKLAEYKLEFPPVWDGMAAAQGQLYLSDTNGKIICFQEKK